MSTRERAPLLDRMCQAEQTGPRHISPGSCS